MRREIGPMQSRILPYAGAIVAIFVSLSASRAEAAAAQYLYVHNTGSPGVYTGEFARYQLPGLGLLETTAVDGVASPQAFGPNGQAYFVDEAPQGTFWCIPTPAGFRHRPSGGAVFRGSVCEHLARHGHDR